MDFLRTRRRFALLHVACIIFLFGAPHARAQTFSLVHRFQQSGEPQSHLLRASDGYFYGTTRWGGECGAGTVYRMDAAGAAVVLHSFGVTDGAEPYAALIEASDGNFYGTASRGGASDLGTVFRMDPSGRVTRLHSFTGADGRRPYAPLLEGSDGGFYGATHAGGVNDLGTVFRVESSGAFTSLHDFTGPDGSTPNALIEFDGDFLGTTFGGGENDQGTVFRMDPAGSVTTVHSFAVTDGSLPSAALLLASDGNFYGTTSNGGEGGYGTVFRMDSSGVVTTHHAFTAVGAAAPDSALIEAAGGNLYGTTVTSAAPKPYYGPGTAYRVGFDGSYAMLHVFSAPAAVTEMENGDLLVTTSATVERMTPLGDVTTIHRFPPPEGSEPQTALIQASDGDLYGTAPFGGAGGAGTAFRLNADGSVTTLHDFSYASLADGVYPYAGLIQATDGLFYGVTGAGGDTEGGTIYRMDSSGNLTTLHNFIPADDGRYPLTLLQAADGDFYGITYDGGDHNFGTLFRMDPSHTLTMLHHFTPAEGGAFSLIQGSDGDFYGTAAGDTFAGESGLLFRIDDSGTLTPLHAMTEAEGYAPQAALLEADDGYFYGTVASGGGHGFGSIYRIAADGTFESLHDFDGTDGAHPAAPLIQVDGLFYGTTEQGNVDTPYGTVFRMDAEGALTTIHEFNGIVGSWPRAGLVQADDGSLYGMTPYSSNDLGPIHGDGVVYRLVQTPLVLNAITPRSGWAAGGDAIDLLGGGFLEGSSVTVGGLPVTDVTVFGPTYLFGFTPVLAAGELYDVTVTNPGSAPTGAPVTLTDAWFADFLDVPPWDIFHDFIESIFRAGITAGCGGGDYCRDDPVTRAQMAVFLLKAEHGAAYDPPDCTGAFTDVVCPSQFADWIEQLAAEGITAGCGVDVYCPDDAVTRAQMAIFLLKTKEGSAYTPPPAAGVFGDVPAAGVFAPWIEELASRQITAGCQASPPLYCPDSPNTRGQMAVFIVKTFHLQ